MIFFSHNYFPIVDLTKYLDLRDVLSITTI
jgi:hypothetical protein